MEDLLKKLNDLYTELEFEEDYDTIKMIKREIHKIEKRLKEEKDNL